MSNSRYFRLHGSLLELVKEFFEGEFTEHNKRIKSFCEEIGTNDLLIASGFGTQRVVGFAKAIPGTKPFKGHPDYFCPRLSTKEGKQLEKKLAELTEPNPDKFYEAAGLRPFYFVDNKVVSPGLNYYPEPYPMAIFKMPAIDYTPHPEMEELKEWQFLKLMDEAKEEA